MGGAIEIVQTQPSGDWDSFRVQVDNDADYSHCDDDDDDFDDVDDYLVVTGTVLRYRLSLIVFCKSWSTPPLGNRVFRYWRRSEVIEPGKKKRQLETFYWR